MLKYILLALFAAQPAAAQAIRQNGGSGNASGLGATVNCANGTSINVDANTFYVDCTNNRIGIGTSAPNNKLHVVGDPFFQISDNIHIATGTAGGQDLAAITFGVATSDSMDIYGRTGHSMGLGANGAISMTLNKSGNIGIGTANPAAKLHISSSVLVMDGTGSPTKASALCLTAAGLLGACDGLVGADGTCTCTSP